MEKYKRFSDPASGINPFLPPKVTQSAALLTAVGVFSGLFRAPLALVVFLGYAVASFPFHVLSIRPLLVILDRTLLRVFLLLCGTLPSSAQDVVPLSRSFASIGSTKEPSNSSKSVYICNWSSVFDVLILQSLYSPTFVVPCAKGVRVLSMWQCLSHLACFESMQVASMDGIEFRAASAASPIVILAEGTTSNNLGILKFQDAIVDKILLGTSSASLLVVKYRAATWRPVHTVQSGFLKTVIHTLFTVQHRVALYITPSVCPAAPMFLKLAREHMARNMLDGHALVLDMNDRREFLKFFRSTSSTSKAYVR
eukprot:ANDGO_08016.mRNA.1 hypothetical protein SPRG_07719